MKLSAKLSFLVFLSTMLVIVGMSFSFYNVSKSFYKQQLKEDIEHRLAAHRDVIENDFHTSTLEHVVVMEKRETESFFIIFDQDLNVINSTHPLSESSLVHYTSWLVSQDQERGKTEFVETIPEHIPHVWSYIPIKVGNDGYGYLFIDQETGSFEQAQTQLFVITFAMGALAFLLSAVLIVFLSKKITDPLVEARDYTQKIAKGDFHINISAKGNDEIGDLMKHISSMAKQLKEYSDTRQQFLSNVSHDIRTPLTYIKAYSALMKEKNVSVEEVKEQSAIIHSEAIRMERLVNDLFQLMKLEEGKLPMTITEVNLNELLNSIIQKLQLEATQKNIQLDLLVEKENIKSSIDPERMEQALMNLLTNALRYTPNGGRIHVIIEDSTSSTLIKIADTGEGIPSADLPYIWDRFYRVDKSRSSRHGGSGLGLAITKQIIEQHQGKITVKSQLHKGTTFTITLPKSL
ncbi:sensor histidine kinase [Halalkalibacterium ligniniphilum]|uniref:sensor histidine kinase n=1 Tax=Halalkalibacterium ligniniphilum TaxID=1134413 RepID=UPI0003484E5B|nr:HAMP domain-containing sensor histidine kinase [Halalkalibacterium ligniniphilum]